MPDSLPQPNMKMLEPVESSTSQGVLGRAAPSAPALPANPPSPNPHLRTTLAPSQQLQPDALRQFYNNGVPQIRISPLPSTAAASINSAAQGIAKTAISTILIPAAAAPVTDFLTHGDLVWAHDSAYIELRDDFVPMFAATFGPNNTGGIGELGWFVQVGGGSTFDQVGGNPPYMGQFGWDNTTTPNNFASMLLNADVSSGVALAVLQRNAFALLENPGWKMTWVFKHEGSAGSTGDFQTVKKSFYIGLSGPTIQTITTNPASGGCARPDIFVGLRYDTSAIPIGMTISNSQAPSTFFGTFNGGAANAYAGQTIRVAGMTTPGNNGTFTVVNSTNTQIDVTSASITSESPAGQASLFLTSIPLTAAATASGGNTVYTMVDVNTAGSGANDAYLGLSFVITGFATGANNGTFTCVHSTATTLTLSNGSGVAETHAAFATTASLNDSFLTFEVVQNPQFTTAVRHNKQGQTFVTNVVPVAGAWHRLDMTCSAAGVVVMTLDGSATNTWTVTVPKITYTPSAGQAAWTSYEGSLGIAAPGASGTDFWPPFSAGTVLTISGLTGGAAALNGTRTLFSTNGSATRLRWDMPTKGSVGNSGATYAAVGYPALTPFMSYGNDDTADPATTTMRSVVDFFSLVWNPNLGPSAPGTPDPTKARYW